jgi:hypothetical protein
MYKQVETLDKIIMSGNDSEMKPFASLRSEHGGEAHIIVDDGCYELVLKGKDGKFTAVTHWFQEAVEVLKTLPDNPHELTIAWINELNSKK